MAHTLAITKQPLFNLFNTPHTALHTRLHDVTQLFPDHRINNKVGRFLEVDELKGYVSGKCRYGVTLPHEIASLKPSIIPLWLFHTLVLRLSSPLSPVATSSAVCTSISPARGSIEVQ